MRRRLARVVIWASAALGLGLVFMAYLNPHRVLELSNRVWGCF